MSTGSLKKISVAADGYQPYLILVNLTKDIMLSLNSELFTLSLPSDTLPQLLSSNAIKAGWLVRCPHLGPEEASDIFIWTISLE